MIISPWLSVVLLLKEINHNSLRFVWGRVPKPDLLSNNMFQFIALPLFIFSHVLLSGIPVAGITGKSMLVAGFLSLVSTSIFNVGYVQDCVVLCSNVLALDSMFIAIRSLIHSGLRRCSLENLTGFVDFFIESGYNVYLLFAIYGLVTAHFLVVSILLSLPLTLFWAWIWILGPLVLILDFSFLIFCLDLLCLAIFGFRIGSLGVPRSIAHLGRFSYQFYLALGEALSKLLHPRELLVSLLVFAKALVSLPVEFLALILGDGPLVGAQYRSRHFIFRFFLGLDFVLIRLLNLRWLFFVTIIPSLSILTYTSYLLYLMFGEKIFNLWFITFLQTISNFSVVRLDSIVLSLHDQTVRIMVSLLLNVRFYTTGGTFVVSWNGQLREITPTFSALTADIQLVRAVFNNLNGFKPMIRVHPFYILVLSLLFFRLFVLRVYKTSKLVFRAPVVFFECVILMALPWVIPDVAFELVEFGFYKLTLSLFSSNVGFWPEVKRWARFCGLGMFVGVSYLSGPLESEIQGGLDVRGKMSQIFVLSWVSMTRRSVLKFVETLDKVRLPEMIQASYNPPSLDSIRSTYSTLQGMGFPVDQGFIDSLERPENSAYLAEWGSWRNWMIGTSNFRLGFRDIKMTLHSWLPSNFFPEVPGYIHSATFTGVVEELTATARYWSGNELSELPDGSDLDDLVDDVWEGVKAQYDASRLATFNEVYSKWTKRFNMGFGFGENKNGKRLKQLTRQAVIDAMGGKKPFLKAWEQVFYNAQKLLLPSPVFTKWETLKLKKALSRSVRTVVGSAFTHHVMTTVFNYKPNHNYHPWETPSKVGMPINGQNYNRLWESLMRHELVWAGDMTAFDSTQAPVILKVCAEIRKKGFTMHKDYDRICQLIDISYEMLRDQPMAFKNFGDIAIKAQGATTGHSSTTPDNTIMLLVNYMYAWRRVTGLRAREFFNFNTLVNFGDDHVLGYDSVYGWTPQAAARAMAELGTIMRDEAPGQNSLPIEGKLPPGKKDFREQDFAFLSKMPLPLTPDIRSELAAAGVNCRLSFATCHDKRRLLGKVKGQLTVSRGRNILSSYDALLSYMYLTAHHKDVYDALAKNAASMHLQVVTQVKRSKGNLKSIQRPPSYNKVLQVWYSADPFPYKNDDLEDNDENLDHIYIYSTPDAFGVFIRWVSDFPTLLSPRYKNVRWADWIQQKLADRLAWPLNFVAAGNGTAGDLMTSKLLMSRTPYSFLRNEAIVINDDSPEAFGRNLLRHWIFIGLTRVFTYRKAFSPLDLVRLFDSFWINVVFILTGRVTQIAVELDLHILDTLIIILLSFVHFELPIPPVLIDLLSPSILIARLLTYLLSIFQPAGAIDYQSLDEQIRHLGVNANASFVLSAPTGVGKSTRMVNRIQEMLAVPITVIVPRHAVVLNVGKYMQSLYPNSGIGMACEGQTFQPNDRIVYCTAQSFFMNPLLRAPNRLFILDEAHITEPHYQVLHTYFDNPLLKRIFVTATPLDSFNLPLIHIPAVNSFSVIEKDIAGHTLEKYLKAAAGFANDRLSNEKILIFVPTLNHMDRLIANIRHKVCRVSSKHRILDPSATVFVSTSVTDAGVTIPDVNFVLSPDIDIAVSESTVEAETAQIVSYFFKLSEQTLRQRRGRTGRTCDGVFLKFNIIDLPLSNKYYTFADFISNLSPASAEASRYFPQSILDTVPIGILKGLENYDLNPTPFGVLMRRYKDSMAAGVDMDAFWASRLRATKASRPPYRVNPVDPDALPVESWKFSEVPVDADPIAPPPGKGKPVQITTFSRINVPGTGLLCGAFALRGLIWSHLHVLFSVDLIRDLLSQISHFQETNFFHFDYIRDLAWAGFHLRLTLVSSQAPNYVHPYYMAGPLPDGYREGVIYLEHLHYQYDGLLALGHDQDSLIQNYLDPNYLVPLF